MTVTSYIWDEDTYLAEADGMGTFKTLYTCDGSPQGLFISVRASTTTSYYHFDVIGSVRQLSSPLGTSSDTWIYNSAGTTVARTGSTANALLWIGAAGYLYDSDIDRYWVRRRMYQPSIGRWNAMDPLGPLISTNGYVYSHNAPLNWIDPSGLLSCVANQLGGGLFVSACYCIKGAFLDGSFFVHSCLEVAVYDGCCDPPPKLKETYALELRPGPGNDNTIGHGPVGAGIGVENGNGEIVSAQIPLSAWIIEARPGGKCDGRCTPIKRLTNNGFAEQAEQCDLGKCMYDLAKAIAQKATNAKAAYDLFRRNCNSFAGEVTRRCNGHVSDEVNEYINDGRMPGWNYNFSNGARWAR